MALEKSAKLSEEAYHELVEYRDEHGHTSIDSAVRELLRDEQLPDATITTNGDHPAVELPNGERFTLNVHINRVGGEQIEYDTEVCSDDFSWWHLVTDSDLEVTIMPQLGWHNVE